MWWEIRVPTMTLKWITATIDKLMKSLFYGELTIKFEAGRIVYVAKKETLRPDGGN